MLSIILISVSLLLLLLLGVAALFLAGDRQASATADREDKEKDELTS